MRTSDITDITSSVPKVVGPSGHAILDYLSAGSFIAMGFGLMNRNRSAANLAFCNGLAVLGLSLMTDYPGGVFRTISFKTHGAIDALQAGMTALGPTMLGFADEPEAQFFYAQAALEAAAVAATDWDATGMRQLGA